MTTILEEPYMMMRKAKPGELLRGNDRYEGYCKVIIQCTVIRWKKLKLRQIEMSGLGRPDY